ncbi:MAG: FMN-binding negative transcriptional regulator, partial [Amphritea sp.]|nr:FMN-binding negative transcriptional regulator [Amphritea sp.]
ITHSDSGLEANHIPMLLGQSEGKDVLQGHLSKANPLWKNITDGSEVLIVFHGPNSYISPNYYPTKQETGKVVPTWNYVTVHVKGAITFIHDESWNMELITNLTDQHEAGQLKPWSVSDAPKDFTKKMLSAIVGLQIDISSIVGKWKVSQNQPEKNKLGVVAGLSQCSESESLKMAAIVQDHIVEGS